MFIILSGIDYSSLPHCDASDAEDHVPLLWHSIDTPFSRVYPLSQTSSAVDVVPFVDNLYVPPEAERAGHSTVVQIWKKNGKYFENISKYKYIYNTFLNFFSFKVIIIIINIYGFGKRKPQNLCYRI